MRYVPFIVHIHNTVWRFSSINTSTSVVHAVIECTFEVLKEKKMLELRLLLSIYTKESTAE